MATENQVSFARKLESRWLGLLAIGDNSGARDLSPVVDAVYANDPGEAIIRCREAGYSEAFMDEIREIFEL